MSTTHENSSSSSSLYISPMMAEINAEALKRARFTCQKRFIDLTSLEDIALMKSELSNRLSSADTQLKGAVQIKLDALKRAQDIMDHSTNKLKEFSENIEWTEARIRQTNTSITKYENLKNMHYARDNLNKVIAQVEYFTNIPERVSQLRKTLQEEPEKLKEVYLETLKLEAWRSALLKELHNTREARNTLSKDGDNKGNEKQKAVRRTASGQVRTRVQSTAEMYSNEMYGKIIGVVGSHLESVLELAKEVRNCVWGNIERLFDLAVKAPEEVVMTFEVIEMHQEYVDRRVHRARLAASEGGRKAPSAEELGYDNIRDEASERLQRNLSQKVEAKFLMIEATLPKTSGAKMAFAEKVKSTLQVATASLTVIAEFKNEVAVCIPPSYNAMKVFIDTFVNTVQPQIAALIANPEVIEVSEMVQLIDWLEYCCSQLLVFDPNFIEHPCYKDFTTTSQELMHDYLHRIKNQVMEWFGNIKKQPMEIVQGTDGTLLTAVPEDMFNVVHMQIAVAKEKLPKEHLKDVVNSCLQVLREVQRQSYDSLNEKWNEMDPESLCATINDTQRMQEKCEEFNERVLILIPQEEDRNMLNDILEEISSEYIALAIKAVSFLVKIIIVDFDEPVFKRLFTSDWESGEQIIAIATATLNDYLSDLQHWLPSYFFSKFLKEVAQEMVYQYVMAMKNVVFGSFQFYSSVTATSRVLHDIDHLTQFFSTYSEVLKRGGLESTIDNELLPMKHLAKILASEVNAVENDVTELYARWGRDALKVVHSAIGCNPSFDKSEKQENVEIASKLYDKMSGSGLVPIELNKDGKDSTYMSPIASSSKDKTKGGKTTKTSKWKMFGGKG